MSRTKTLIIIFLSILVTFTGSFFLLRSWHPKVPRKDIGDTDLYGCYLIETPRYCEEKLECEPVYSQTDLDQKGEYEKCRVLPEEEIRKIRLNFVACAKSNGEWLAAEKKCYCAEGIYGATDEEMEKSFQIQHGCMFNKDICEVHGGAWNSREKSCSINQKVIQVEKLAKIRVDIPEKEIPKSRDKSIIKRTLTELESMIE
jgi:hypothetical protein